MSFLNSINNLEKSLNASSLRQKTITNNIANVDTPGYKTMDISFDEILTKEKSKYTNTSSLSFQGYRTDPRHFSIGSSSDQAVPKLEVEDRTSLLNNENNVDIDYEMAKLAENNIWYSSLTEVINKEFSILRYAINGGR